MVDLVTIKNGEVLADSLVISKKFEKPHDRVLKAVEKLKEDVEKIAHEKKRAKKDKYIFKEISRSVRGRKYKAYEMNRNAFSLLAMGFTGQKVLEWKIDYISAFNKMEEILLNKLDSNWKQVRDDSKKIRLELTGCISEFVEYCFSQGSKNAKHYFGNITKMEYVALKFLEQKEKVPSKFRDTLGKMELFMLVMAEHVANETIKKGMEDGLHYKEIFLLAKQAVLKYADTVLLNKIE